MEKKFEEKFGLKVEEMSEILGGEVLMGEAAAAASCNWCQTCIYCSTCIGCTSGCMLCNTVAFTQTPLLLPPEQTPITTTVSSNLTTLR